MGIRLNSFTTPQANLVSSNESDLLRQVLINNDFSNVTEDFISFDEYHRLRNQPYNELPLLDLFKLRYFELCHVSRVLRTFYLILG